ncbi:isocitrate lyase/phosphoenolpyruvate mutase family protein [Flavobacterium sp. 3HN19-14]|uniref:isocitrate lyase/phosphoenolpyruvate mutase family protein n=1 Tax=Flavobacterium sp. 3HN19-14 TaxID=3448133 RepID=UPI003EDF2D59
MKNSVQIFRNLHENDTPLILPLAWDAASAKLFANAGAKAIATSSAALSWALGYADGNNVPFDKLKAVVENILRVTDLPLSVDVEGGYSENTDKVAEKCHAACEIGNFWH